MGKLEKLVPFVVPARPPARLGAPALWEARGLGTAVPQGAEESERHLPEYIYRDCIWSPAAPRFLKTHNFADFESVLGHGRS